jgi:hypothetical protein
LHEDIDGAGGWTGDEVLGVEAGEGDEEEGGMLDINQEALLMDEDMDLEMHSGEDGKAEMPSQIKEINHPKVAQSTHHSANQLFVRFGMAFAWKLPLFFHLLTLCCQRLIGAATMAICFVRRARQSTCFPPGLLPRG